MVNGKIKTVEFVGVTVKSVKIVIGKREIELSLSEARELSVELKELFGDNYPYFSSGTSTDSATDKKCISGSQNT